MIAGMLRILVIALVALVAAMLLMPDRASIAPPPSQATVLDAPRPLPDVSLIDQYGDEFSLDELEGRPTLVFFGFTNCPDICPITLGVLADAVATLREEAADLVPQVLFVSVDPARDTPERIRGYLGGFDDDFIGVTAPDAALEPLLTALAVTVHRQQVGDDAYNVVHNGTIYVLDRAARWVALFGGSAHDAPTIANDYLAIEARSME